MIIIATLFLIAVSGLACLPAGMVTADILSQPVPENPGILRRLRLFRQLL